LWIRELQGWPESKKDPSEHSQSRAEEKNWNAQSERGLARKGSLGQILRNEINAMIGEKDADEATSN